MTKTEKVAFDNNVCTPETAKFLQWQKPTEKLWFKHGIQYCLHNTDHFLSTHLGSSLEWYYAPNFQDVFEAMPESLQIEVYSQTIMQNSVPTEKKQIESAYLFCTKVQGMFNAYYAIVAKGYENSSFTSKLNFSHINATEALSRLYLEVMASK